MKDIRTSIKFLIIFIVISTSLMCKINNSGGFPKTFKQSATVTNFGAKGDGKTDDTKAIESCINYAVLHKIPQVVFPKGTYVISSSLVFNVNQPHLKIVGNDATLYSSRLLYYLRFINQGSAQNVIDISNLNIKGKLNQSLMAQYYDGNVNSIGIQLTEYEKGRVANCSFTDIYGEGIHVRADKNIYANSNTRIPSLIIENNNLKNVYGLKPTPVKRNGQVISFDSYGDGICLIGGHNIMVRNNVVINDLNFTKKLGRCGIVSDTKGYNITFENNEIFGYDRGIHIEQPQGGFVVKSNKIDGCAIGIIISAMGASDKVFKSNPSSVTNNVITNKGLLPVYLNTGIIKPQALLYFYQSATVHDNTIVEDNVLDAFLKLPGQNFVMISHQKNLIVRRNKIKGTSNNKPIVYFSKKLVEFSNNEFDNLKYIDGPGGATRVKENKGAYSNITEK